jgi:UDP-N-acetyl-alpha-D-muramoyl-L-alanyl-L-glutamate epimerase
VTERFDPADYPVFGIDGYDMADGTFTVRYGLRGGAAPELTFAEIVEFGRDLPRPVDERLLRLLALTCSPSYYKAAAGKRIEIAFPTFGFERDYLRELLAGGLGEFAYRNGLPDALSPEITGPEASAESHRRPDAFDAAAQPLVPVGGGKDSVVTIELLKHHGIDPMLFSVNEFEPIDRCIAISGLDSTRVRRRIDRLLIEVNARGAHNGHVPVTAINSVIGLIVADARGLGPVVFSNERSSNVGNVHWMGRDVNHQWSKSVHYEALLRNALTSYGLNPDRYFSLLRALSESRIADHFRDFGQYFEAFISCNRPFALDPARRAASWCGHCPKCLFVFLLMGPRLGRTQLEKIFGRNVFDDPDVLPGVCDVVGLGVHKPFECVGEYYEAAEAAVALLDDADWSGLAVVEALRPRRVELAAVAATEDTSPAPHFVPARYAAALDD